MDNIDLITLRKMNYHELRTCAKKFNIKCNAKANKLMDAILEKVNQQNHESNMISENGNLAETPLMKEQLNVVNEDSPKTPAAVSKARRRTYELTPETTLVLDVDTAQDVAKTNPLKTTEATAPIHITADVTNSNHAKAMKSKSQIPAPKKTQACVYATPNFRKIHERAFAKMDSLDVYVAKKAARGERHKGLQQSVKSVRSLGLKFAKQSSAVAESKIFKPSVLSTSAMNLNFSPRRETRQSKASAAKSKIPTLSATTPFCFNRESNLQSSRSLLQKISVSSKKTTAKPTFRYQPPKYQEKEKSNGAGCCAKQSARDKTRSMLKGVRLNKRFELQLEARGLSLK